MKAEEFGRTIRQFDLHSEEAEAPSGPKPGREFSNWRVMPGATSARITALPSRLNGNKLLGQLPGQYIVDAMSLLPPCNSKSAIEQLTIDIGLFGRFRVTYKPFRNTRRTWRSGWFWIAVAAEPAE